MNYTPKIVSITIKHNKQVTVLTHTFVDSDRAKHCVENIYKIITLKLDNELISQGNHVIDINIITHFKNSTQVKPIINNITYCFETLTELNNFEKYISEIVRKMFRKHRDLSFDEITHGPTCLNCNIDMKQINILNYRQNYLNYQCDQCQEESYISLHPIVSTTT